MNYSKGVKIKPIAIVIHETDNWNKGANALAHYNYWNTNSKANSSAHFVVDDSNIIQLAELDWRCWHVGDNRGYSIYSNDNTIGIEICVNAGGNYSKARQNCIDLVKHLLQVTGLKVTDVKRHKDVSGKKCPRNMIDNPSLWIDFKNQVELPSDFNEEYYLHIHKDVANAKMNPKEHYLLFGKNEGREYKPSLPEGFNPVGYLIINKDVANAGMTAEYHYLNHGWKEDREWIVKKKYKFEIIIEDESLISNFESYIKSNNYSYKMTEI